MKKILQKIVASDGSGDCVRSAIASIMDMEYNEVPDMSPNTGDQAGILMNFMSEHGYRYDGILYNKKYHILYYTNQFDYCKNGHNIGEEYILNTENISKLKGINGLFIATVFSPKFTIPYQGMFGHHQVICDSNFNIVFGPGPEYQELERYPLSDLIGYNGICMIDVYEKNN